MHKMVAKRLKTERVLEMEGILKQLAEEINASPGGIQIWFHQQLRQKQHMSFDGGAGKLYLKPFSVDKYEIALSTSALSDEMGGFMLEITGRKHDKYNQNGDREPRWIVDDLSFVRRAAYRYAHKQFPDEIQYHLPDDISNAPVDDGMALEKWIEENRQRAEALPFNVLKERAHHAQPNPRSFVRQSTAFIRSHDVSVYVKKRANGDCDLCGEKAPFNNLSGEPYLESHHVEWMSQGGADSVRNVVALCPNCHRKMHIVNSSDDCEKLRMKISSHEE